MSACPICSLIHSRGALGQVERRERVAHRVRAAVRDLRCGEGRFPRPGSPAVVVELPAAGAGEDELVASEERRERAERVRSAAAEASPSAGSVQSWRSARRPPRPGATLSPDSGDHHFPGSALLLSRSTPCGPLRLRLVDRERLARPLHARLVAEPQRPNVRRAYFLDERRIARCPGQIQHRAVRPEVDARCADQNRRVAVCVWRWDRLEALKIWGVLTPISRSGLAIAGDGGRAASALSLNRVTRGSSTFADMRTLRSAAMTV